MKISPRDFYCLAGFISKWRDSRSAEVPSFSEVRECESGLATIWKWERSRDESARVSDLKCFLGGLMYVWAVLPHELVPLQVVIPVQNLPKVIGDPMFKHNTPQQLPENRVEALTILLQTSVFGQDSRAQEITAKAGKDHHIN